MTPLHLLLDAFGCHSSSSNPLKGRFIPLSKIWTQPVYMPKTKSTSVPVSYKTFKQLDIKCTFNSSMIIYDPWADAAGRTVKGFHTLAVQSKKALLVHSCLWLYGVERLLRVSKLGPCLICFKLFSHSTASCIFPLKDNVRWQFSRRHCHIKKDSATVRTPCRRLANCSVATIGKSLS
jgi:hypothetical protein